MSPAPAVESGSAPAMCPSCGVRSDARLPYCVHCGAARSPSGGGERRTVTVVFSDLKGSTALAERLDAESMREVMGHYVDEMRLVLESHGGRIEKIIGDAIVAVFGLWSSAADHALSGVQAAHHARKTLEDLNEGLEDRWGIRLVNRTGVCTGEVIIGRSSGGHRIMSGEAMELAEQMERNAPPLGVLLTHSTYEIVSDRVDAVPLDSASHDDKEPVRAFVLRDVSVSTVMPLRQEGDAGACGACGQPDDGGGKWCGRCGYLLRVASVKEDSRRTLTILFADARTVSTRPAAPSAQAVQAAKWCYFEMMRAILERHGATVEKYIGDAVMAVFGLPRRTEEDALRAMTAAAEMQAAMPEVNAVLRRDHDLVIEQRIGVNTGTVVAGDAALGQRLVTGDAVNVAARLEQAALPGGVLLGEPTLRLVRDMVEIEALEPLTLKGKSAFMRAYRLVKVGSTTDAEERLQTPTVGRDDELRRLETLYVDAVTGQRAHAVTVVGDAGVGKTRLAGDLVDSASLTGARVLRGRCLSYGEGITFLPLVEALREAAGIAGDDSSTVARAKLLGVGGGLGSDVAERVATLMGLSDDPFQLAELFWATRRLLEILAREAPVVVHLDDVHWAEETLLDLLDHLASETQGPLTLLLTARPSLLERRPEWGEGEGRALVSLTPLSDADLGALVDNLLGGSSMVAHDLKAAIVGAAGGNPLFAEQLTSMLAESGRITRRDGTWQAAGPLTDLTMPPTVEALLASRVDDLPEHQRAVLEPASVIGRDFARDAVEALVPDGLRPGVDVHLAGLVARQMVAAVPDEWPFDHRFQHSMIRDVAYDGLLKRSRADLHERFVAWAENAGLVRNRAVELEEILGYHLEQSHRYRGELGPLDEHGIELGRRAAALLGSAGQRSLTRGDMPTAANLLRRAAEVLPSNDPAAPRLLLHVGEAEMEMGTFPEAEATLRSASRRAEDAGERGLSAIAQLEQVRLAYLTGAAGDERDVANQARRAVRRFTASGDHEGLARAWRLTTYVELTRCQWGSAERAAVTMIDHARRAGDTLMATRVLPALAAFILNGPSEASEGILRCEDILREVSDDRRATALTHRALAHLRAMRGDFPAARDEYRGTRAALEELGWHFDAALVSLDSGPIELLAGDPSAAEVELLRDFTALKGMGERNYISTTAALLAEALYRQDRLDDAESFVATSREIAADDDVITQVVWRTVAGKILARRGSIDEGEAACRAALDLISVTDDLNNNAATRADLAEVLGLAGRVTDALAQLEEATRLFTDKGNVVAAQRTRARADALAAATGA